MNIETHILTWNRYNTIHLTINHYKQFGKVIVHDNFSDDGTWEIGEMLGAEMRLFGKAGVLDDGEYLKVKNNAWKGSQADWVIVVDDDEILYHPYLLTQLQVFKDDGVTIIQPKGFAVFSNDMPVNNWLDITDGIVDENYSKLCCFNPKALTEISYEYGCHRNTRPKGRVKIGQAGVLLHYQAVGGVQRMIDRHKLYEPRRLRSPVNVRWGLGKEYGYSEESKKQWFKERLEKSGTLSEAGLL